MSGILQAVIGSFLSFGPLKYQLWSWGNNNSGQLGLNNAVNRSSPVQVGAGEDWEKVAAGFGFSLAIKSNGTLWSWGGGAQGRLGLNDVANRSSPVQVGTLTNWAEVNGNVNSSLAIKTNGTLWAWGVGSFGALGQNNTIALSSPVQIGALTNWGFISQRGCSNMNAAIKTDNTLWTWGRNGVFSQLGLGDTANRSSPTQVGGLSNWSKVSTGYGHVLAVKTDGTLWAWGKNQGDGTLGNGNVGNVSSPIQIGALTNWKDVSAGDHFSMAIKNDNTLWAWGRNTGGQLGLNDIVSRSSPVQVGVLSDWATLRTGRSSTNVIKSNQSLWAWGATNNFYGQLGLNDIVNRSSPVQVGSSTNWYAVALNSHTLAIKTP